MYNFVFHIPKYHSRFLFRIGDSRPWPHAPPLYRLPRSQAGQHLAGRERPCPHLRSRTRLWLLQEEAARLGRHTWLYGARSAVEGHTVRFVGRLVQPGLHAVQTAEGSFAVSAAQNQRQTRDRPDDVDNGTWASAQLSRNTLIIFGVFQYNILPNQIECRTARFV